MNNENTILPKRSLIRDIYLDECDYSKYPNVVVMPDTTIEAECYDDSPYSADVKLYKYYNGNEKTLTIHGYIKWDGCANLEFCDDECSTVHICGVSDWRSFSKFVEEMFRVAFEIMGEVADEGASEL